MSKTREEIAAAYDSPTWWYDLRGFFILTFCYQSSVLRQLRFFGRNIGPVHLEAACGTGRLLTLVLIWRRWKGLPHGRIVGIDYAEPMLNGARKHFSGRAEIELRQADVANVPYSDQTFDTVNVANAMHCFPDLEGALADLCRVLKESGTLAVNVLLFPRGSWPLRPIAEKIVQWGVRKGILVTPYEQMDFRRRVEKAGFEVTSETVSGNCCDFLLRRKPKL